MLALDDETLRGAIARIAPDPTRAARYVLHDIVQRNFTGLATLQEKYPPLRFAYSVEACPRGEILDAARNAELFAGVVSGEELEIARDAGFNGHVVYNGPIPAWRANNEPAIVFSDSIEAFIENAQRLEQSLVGIRFRPKGIDSRFGITRAQIPSFLDALRASGRTETGVAFHVRVQDYGPRTWREITVEALAFAADIEQESAASIVCFDVGGGRTPSAFDRSVHAGDFAWLVKAALKRLPHLRVIFAEPGRAVVTPTQILVAPVLERRHTNAHYDIVVEAGAPEMARLATHPSRLFAQTRDGIVRLSRGKHRILASTTLEGDFLSRGVDLPEPAELIEAIIVADVGAYDESVRLSTPFVIKGAVSGTR